FHPGLVTNDFVALFDCTDTADIQTYRAIELKGVTTGGGFRAAEHHADLHTNLVDEHQQAVGVFDVTGELAQSLRHQTSLETDVAVAHFAFDFCFRSQGGNRVYNDDVNR